MRDRQRKRVNGARGTKLLGLRHAENIYVHPPIEHLCIMAHQERLDLELGLTSDYVEMNN